MFVLRVETFTGEGCYSTGSIFYIHDDTCPCDLSGEHPMANKDGRLGSIYPAIESGRHPHIKTWRFCFTSPLQYLSWFYSSAARDKLASSDFILRVYEVPDHAVEVGNCQAVYERTTARHHMTLRPNIDPGALWTLWNTLPHQKIAQAA